MSALRQLLHEAPGCSRLMGPPPPPPSPLPASDALDSSQLGSLVGELPPRSTGESEEGARGGRDTSDDVSGIDGTSGDTENAEVKSACGFPGNATDRVHGGVPKFWESGSRNGSIEDPEKPAVEIVQVADLADRKVAKTTSPYSVPPWSAPPGQPYSLEVLKDGIIVTNLDVSKKGAYMFGRSDLCDFMLEHPAASRYHAVLQFKRNGHAFIYDLGSTHGTFVNKLQIQAKVFLPVHVGDVIKFGLSSRLYILQGPIELMPKEGPTKIGRQILRQFQYASEQGDCEASILRARRDASEMEGATWGMIEDAIEEDPKENEEEITWQNYRGPLSAKQQKTLDKIQKRNEKLTSLRREIDAIQVKEIPQGGLTQGQQTQIARNEQRIEQLMEELENLEETLNQSIQESIGARTTKGRGKGNADDEDVDMSDDDDFYDRTKLGHGRNKKEVAMQIVETAESLLDKKEKVAEKIENLLKLLELEETSPVTCNETEQAQKIDSQDPLDAFMTGVSTTLVKDRAACLKRELVHHQSELDRIIRLLKIADPTGDAARKWHSEIQLSSQFKSSDSSSSASYSIPPSDGTILESNTKKKAEKHSSLSNNDAMKGKEQGTMQACPSKNPDVYENEKDTEEGNGLSGPVWLGAGRDQKAAMETPLGGLPVEESDSKDFIDYMDRKKANAKFNGKERSGEIPDDAAGLFLWKPTSNKATSEHIQEQGSEDMLWAGAAALAAESVAQLLRHKRGLGATSDDDVSENVDALRSCQARETEVQQPKRRKRLGPEKPAFLDARDGGDYESWLPPQGQTGDGRTSLNEKFGY